MTTRVLVVGEVLIDVVRTPDGAVSEHVGGSPANVATGLARLGHSTDFATTFGRDDHGMACLDHVKGLGVEVLPSSRTADPTSVADATIDESGAATYVFDLHWNLAPVPVRSGVGHLHTGSIAATVPPGGDTVLRTVHEVHDEVTVSYDPNIRPSIMGEPAAYRPRVEELVALADVVKASGDDLELLYPGRPLEDVLEHWAGLGASLAVVTLGGDGVVYRVPATGGVCRAPARVLDPDLVVDTVGAGDSFMAGLVSGLLDAGLLGGPQARAALRAATEADVEPAITRALGTSGVTVRHAGAYSPTRDELEG
jgi:fructokinase